MPLHPSPTLLFPILECPELMADACLCDEQRNLVFLSVWGRDTAVQEFLAKLTLGHTDQGLDEFHVVAEDGLELSVSIPNVDRLSKRTTRTFRGTLFGSLIHLWLFDKRCALPDMASASAIAILPKEAPDETDRLWQLVQRTCPLPLLDHWRDTVLDELKSRALLSSLSFDLGPVRAFRLSIEVDTLTNALGELIRADVLGIYPISVI